MTDIILTAKTLNIQRRNAADGDSVSHITLTGKEETGGSFNLKIPAALWAERSGLVVEDAMAELLGKLGPQFEAARASAALHAEGFEEAVTSFFKEARREAGIRVQRAKNHTLDEQQAPPVAATP